MAASKDAAVRAAMAAVDASYQRRSRRAKAQGSFVGPAPSLREQGAGRLP
jgi:hypothetical protein